jgi:hypothetical protein
MTVSLVEVSLSTVMQLKVLSAISRVSFWRTGKAMRASVKMKPSIVAMSGAIMPEPFTKPAIRTSSPPIDTLVTDSFG